MKNRLPKKEAEEVHPQDLQKVKVLYIFAPDEKALFCDSNHIVTNHRVVDIAVIRKQIPDRPENPPTPQSKHGGA